MHRNTFFDKDGKIKEEIIKEYLKQQENPSEPSELLKAVRDLIKKPYLERINTDGYQDIKE